MSEEHRVKIQNSNILNALIEHVEGKPLGIAGLWSSWKNPKDGWVHSFTMLTINADDHPFMQQFHKPDDEKRMVVVLDSADYDAWLQAPDANSRDFLKQFPADNLVAQQPQQSLL